MSKDVAIIGAGVSGLSAAWKLAENGFRINVFEKEDVIGGISSTFSHGECKLDYGPHKIYTQLDDIYAEIKKLLGPDLLEIEKKSRIRLEGKYFDYPVTIFQLIFRMNPSITMGIGISYLYAILNSKVSKVRDDSYESYLINRFGKSLCSLVFFPYAKKIWGEPKTLASSLAESRVPIPSLSELAKRK
ncbi:MAG: FAD-dependent oxidoreductase, partial [Methanothrix sp.]|nr:FAD-dependent oxidoreductase [Methanothrix sp.]